MTPPVVLAIAGTDPSGGAGLAADLATFAALGVHGTSVVTAVTVQDTTAVHAIYPIPLDVVEGQLTAVLADVPPRVIKTGMLGTPEVVRLVAKLCTAAPVVVDPVLRASSGATLGDAAVLAAYRDHLLPVAAVLTPNRDEAAALLDADPATPPAELAAALHALGPAVVLTGGPQDLTKPEATCTDWLAAQGETVPLVHPAVATRADHGTGCTYASALGAHLAHGLALTRAATAAAVFVQRQLAEGSTWLIGRGRGPVPHVYVPAPTVKEISA